MSTDDGHLCVPLYDEAGELVAVVRGRPDMPVEVREALVELAEVARRRFAQGQDDEGSDQ